MATLQEMIDLRQKCWNYFTKVEEIDMLYGFKSFLISDDIESITIKLKPDKKILAGNEEWAHDRQYAKNEIQLTFEKWGITKEIFASIVKDFDERIKKIAEETGIIDYTPPGGERQF